MAALLEKPFKDASMGEDRQLEGYSYTEIGMLAGISAGGALSITFFSLSGNLLSFIIAALGLAVGVLFGNMIERKQMQK